MQTERSQVDGIPTFWAPAPGQFTAALQFRVGVADETLPVRGVTHLIEHLALFASASRSDEANGFVDAERCVFYARGDRDEVLDWLRRCTEALAALPLDRLATERRILRAEEAGRDGVGILARLFETRFGATGYGLANYHELGLRWLGDDEVAAWARERFTRGNAALWMTGEPPATLGLALPEGDRLPPPPVDPQPGREGRLFQAGGSGGLAVGGIGERSTALTVAVGVAFERLYTHLRRELGLVYEPWAGYDILGPRHAHVLMGAECTDEQASKVAAEVWRVAGELCEGGATREEILQYLRGFRQVEDDPGAALHALDHAAAQELLGEPPIDRAEVAREIEALEPQDVAAALRRAFEDALFVVPRSVTSVEGFREVPFEWPEPVAWGSVYADDKERGGVGSQLRIGDRGLTVGAPGATAMTVLWDQIVLAESGPVDTLRLTARDGSWIELQLSAFGDAARAAVLDRLAVPVIPIATIEATEAVEALAGDLEDEHHIAAELAALPRELGENEVPEAVMAYRHGDQRGLLALTSDRLIRWYIGRESDGEAIPRDAIRTAQVRRRLLRPPVLVVEHEQPLELTVDDAEAAEALAERLSASAD
jgi:predicted Zn-dependent peptidase